MGGEKNLIPFSERTEEEQREMRSKGGKASGEARRRKANFRKTLNVLLTSQVEVDNIKDFLEANGVDSTYESAINFAMIQKALQGDVKAYVAIRDTLGTKTKLDEKEQKQKIKTMKAQEAKLKEGKDKEDEEKPIVITGGDDLED